MDADVARLRTLRAVASRINAGGDVAETLGLTLEAFCRETRWIGAVVMEADAREGVVRVIARHEPTRLGPVRRERPWPLVESPVQRVLATGAPVILRDAQAARQYPGYRTESRAQGFRTVVLLPMWSGPGEGDGLVLAASSRRVEDISEPDMAFMELIVQLGSVAFDKLRSLAAEQARVKRQAATAARNEDLVEQVLAGCSWTTFMALMADATEDPFVVVDLASRRISGRGSPWPDTLDGEAWSSALDGELRSEFLALARSCANIVGVETRDIAVRLNGRSLRRTAIVGPLDVDGVLAGALVVFPAALESDHADEHRIEGARLALKVLMLRSHLRMTADAQGIASILSDLFDETARAEDLVERGQRVGMIFDKPAALLLIAFTDPSAITEPIVMEALRAALDTTRRYDGFSAARIDGGIVVHGPANAKDAARWTALTRQALEEVSAATGRDVLGVRSTICTAVSDYPPCFRDGARIIELGRRLKRTGEVTAKDFGPLPVLMSAVEPGAMTAFVQGAIGRVATHDRLRGTAYLPTLASYLDHGGRAQACAAALGLHVTTLRYRLGRLRELFGLAFDTPDERFAIQLALRFQFVLPNVDQPRR